MYFEIKSTWRLFQKIKEVKSQYSVTKHITPLIKLTYYTYKWYCLTTLELQLLKDQSQQGNLWGVQIFLLVYYIIYISMISRNRAKLKDNTK